MGICDLRFIIMPAKHAKWREIFRIQHGNHLIIDISGSYIFYKYHDGIMKLFLGFT